MKSSKQAHIFNLKKNQYAFECFIQACKQNNFLGAASLHQYEISTKM